jgi:molybdopterin-guanine dinucleotide biosynthesis adapter protein
MHELRGGPELTLDTALARLSPCDLALIEGYKTFPIPKLEIWRADLGKPLLHPRDPHIIGIATDSPGALPRDTASRLRVFALSDFDIVATFVAEQAAARPSDG